MIYLDNGATSYPKPERVIRAVTRTMYNCASAGRGGYALAENAAKVLYRCREAAGKLFCCKPEQVVLTNSCTHGLNIAIRSLVAPNDKVVISGFEHNAVVRPLHALNAQIVVAGRKLFDWEDTLKDFEAKLDGAKAAVFTHVSNVFGYILPIETMAQMCRSRGIPFIIDAAQSAGMLDVDMESLGADFIAMPGHKGLLGPQGTGLLLCKASAQPILYGGTGSASIPRTMPEDLPERLEAGTMNVPGIAGLTAGISYVNRIGTEKCFSQAHGQMSRCAAVLADLGMDVYRGAHQAATVSFRAGLDCEEVAHILAQQGIAVRAGFHCAPLAHESAGTLETGTVRVSFGHDTTFTQTERFLRSATKFPPYTS